MILGDMERHLYTARGIKPQIMTEVTTLLHELFEEEVLTKEDMLKMVDLATTSTEDIKTTMDKAGTELLDKIFKDAESGNEAAQDLLKLITSMILKGD